MHDARLHITRKFHTTHTPVALNSRWEVGRRTQDLTDDTLMELVDLTPQKSSEFGPFGRFFNVEEVIS